MRPHMNANMAVQETTSSAAPATSACSPDAGYLPIQTCAPQGGYASESDDEFDVIAATAVEHNHKHTGSKDSNKLRNKVKSILNKPTKLATAKHGELHQPELLNTHTSDDLRDIYISDEVLKQLRLKAGDKEKKSADKYKKSADKDNKSAKQLKRKQAILQRKTEKIASLANKEEQDVNNKGPPKKILKSSLRRRSSLSTGSAQMKGHREIIEEHVIDKAENNNWMVEEKLTDKNNSVNIQSFYINSSSPYLDTIIPPSESICSLKNCTSQNCKGFIGVTEPVTDKEYPFKRADSSDDSGCFSNVSVQSLGSPGGNVQEINFVEYGNRTADIPICMPVQNKVFTMCSACGNEPQGQGSGLCKTCIGRIKYDGKRIGALDELRAYAQSIANSVKKILSISPRQSHEILHTPTPTEDGDGSKRTTTLDAVENVDCANATCPQLQKCKTQICMTVSEAAPKSQRLMNKSMSFDGRVIPHLDESSKSSPMYWPSHEKPSLPISLSTLSESDEDKQPRAVENSIDTSLVDGDYFPSVDKETKQYTGSEDDVNGKLDRARRKITKQLSCMERVRTDSDNRGNYAQLAVLDKKNSAEDNKKSFELQRAKSGISRALNVDTESDIKGSQKYEEEIKALNVFRLKVIHEGSPVDPLYTVQRGKVEDAKDRRAAFMRSATAPNKNHMPKKDSSSEDKSNVTKSAARARRRNTKPDMRTTRSPTPQREERTLHNDQEESQTEAEGLLEIWRDDNSVMAVKPSSRRRSTSYDGRRAMSAKRNELRGSRSRSAVGRNDKENRQRRHASDIISVNKQAGSHTAKTDHPSRFRILSDEENRADGSWSVHSGLYRGSVADSLKYQTIDDPTSRELNPNEANDLMYKSPIAEGHMELQQSPSKASYFGNETYYSQQSEKQFLPTSSELVIRNLNIPALRTESYYDNMDEMDLHNQLVAQNILRSDSVDNVSLFVGGDAYHKQVAMYGGRDVLSRHDSPLYSSYTDRRSLLGRDRSHESKSSTSFHIVTTARSSHSDVAVRKYQSSFEHASSRRQSMYSETDVDTGLIYHFAKRQTTRAHVPAYHDLTAASKDIYAMSGDVSTSASSNSASSTKSEVSECFYTGGFYKHDPFYDNNNIVSSSSSAESSSHLYFEPSSATKRDPSELDIYTGALFSSSQNALSLGRASETGSNPPSDTLKDGSTNNSTRPSVSRMSRRLRHRPHIDVIDFRVFDFHGELFPKSTQDTRETLFSNVSNNSIDLGDDNGMGSAIYEGALIQTSTDPFYTDSLYKSPVFHMNKLDPMMPVMDLRRQDKPVMSRSISATRASSDTCNSMWYNGFAMQRRLETVPDNVAEPVKTEESAYSWQQNDDYYRSSQRPRVTNTRNSNRDKFDQTASNTNNNRFEDLYTGFFEAASSKSYTPEQTYNCRKAASDNWYAESPKSNSSPTDFYDEDVSMSETTKRTSTVDYESTEGAYSSASVFGQANAAYSGSRTYMDQNNWREYDKINTSSSNSYVDESPKMREPTPTAANIGEKYSYFHYVSNQSPEQSPYMYDNGNYSFEEGPDIPEFDINEIKKVGGIVCRENVVNKEDYAEDVNRDLEQGAWMPFNFRHEEKTRHQEDTNCSRSEFISESMKFPTMPIHDKQIKQFDDSSYNQDRIYDNVGARNKWREMTTKKQSNDFTKEEPSVHRAHSAGDAKRQEYVKSGAWNPPDQIPDRARGKRTILSTPKQTLPETSKGGSSAATVISSVTSLPSRLTNYVKKWF